MAALEGRFDRDPIRRPTSSEVSSPCVDQSSGSTMREPSRRLTWSATTATRAG